MTALKVHNDHERPVQLLLEPSGHCFDMPPGSMFEVLPQLDAELEIYHQDPDVMVSGDVAKVVHDGEVLASWDRAGASPRDAASEPERIGSVEDVRAFLQATGEQISAKPDGALLFRQVNRKAWAGRVQWRDEQDLVHIEAATAITAPPEREAALALAISRIHAGNAIPGFRLVHGPSGDLRITYWVILMLDERRTVATSVLTRAIKVCFDMVLRYADRLEVVAKGGADPGTP